MLYLDPDAEKTFEEICREMLDALPPDVLASHQARATEQGLTLQEYLEVKMWPLVDRLNSDQAYSDQFAAELTQARQPLGPDPRISGKT